MNRPRKYTWRKSRPVENLIIAGCISLIDMIMNMLKEQLKICKTINTSPMSVSWLA